MNKLFYPAVFHAEDVGYSVRVPDLDGCITQGDTIEEAYQYAVDAIGLYLEEYLEANKPLPKASEFNSFKTDAGDCIILVEFDSLAYRKMHDNKFIKKTLTIPSWLNTMAEEEHVNFSGILQTALKQHLRVD